MAIAETAVVVVNSEIKLIIEEMIVVIDIGVEIITETEKEAKVAAVASHVGQKFPPFPRVKPQICCQTISRSITFTIKDRYSFIVLILGYSTPIGNLDMKLSKDSICN